MAIEINCSSEMKNYFHELNQQVSNSYEIAAQARILGLDPESTVPIPLAHNMAERVVGLISVVAPQIGSSHVVKRILELEQEYGRLDWRVGFRIAEEVAQEKLCPFANKQEAMEIGIRVGFAYLTLGIVSAPLEGFIGLKIKKRLDGKEYFALQYAGPIRGAGGTAASISVILADYVRLRMGYFPYDPTDKEVSRYVTEVYDYHERVTNLQYLPSEEELKFLISHLPVEVDGDPTEKFEVSNYKDLPRIETNLIRGGVPLVLAEGLSQKAAKIWKRLSKWGKELGLDWEWLSEFLKLKEQIHAAHAAQRGMVQELGQQRVQPNNTFIMDLVAGRPILTHPLATGGFRLRYGRTRMSGFSATALHPATMVVLDKFIAIGTQLKVERPGKAATVTVCDTLEGPIVRLKDGSVLQLKTEAQGRQHTTEIEEIIFLGDILFNYGDFSENGQSLVPAGYCPEWWVLEVQHAFRQKLALSQRSSIADANTVADTVADTVVAEMEVMAEMIKMEGSHLQELLHHPLTIFPSWKEAVLISMALGVPLHPDYLFYWKLVSAEDIMHVVHWLQEGKLRHDEEGVLKIILPYYSQQDSHQQGKKTLDHLGVPHLVVNKETIVLERKEATIFSWCLGFSTQQELDKLRFVADGYADGLALINAFSPALLRDKAGTFIGARMGRPEKSKMRHLTGSPQMMFPVGDEGDRLRSVQAALKTGKVRSTFPLWHCVACQKSMIYPRCEECNAPCEPRYHCRVCGDVGQEQCRHGPTQRFKVLDLDINYYFSKAKERLGEKLHPDLIKGVRGTSNKHHVVEHLAKGILRAKHLIYVNKDGTVRYDCTELPATHFKPKEIKTSLEKLRQLGYTHDFSGQELIHDDQILELKPQDLILPGYDSLDESAAKVLRRVADFIDDLLVQFYGLKRFYNIQKEEDLTGHLVVGLAPHISAGLVGRIIGFSETQALITHPLYHAGLRRDCVHPQTRFVYVDPQRDFSLQITEIGPFVEKLLQRGARTTVIDSVGTIKVEINQSLFALGVNPHTGKVQEKKIKYFIKGPVPPHWIKITTATNRTYTMTPTHDFLYVKDQQFKFKKAREIAVADQLPLVYSLPPPLRTTEALDLLALFPTHLPQKEVSNLVVEGKDFFRKLVKRVGRKKIIPFIGQASFRQNLHRWYRKTPLPDVQRLIQAGLISSAELGAARVRLRIKFSLTSYPAVLPVDENLMSLLGYYVAEGYCRKSRSVSQVSFRVENKEIQQEIISLIKKVFSINPSLGENSTKITICDQLIYNLFQYCFKTDSTAYAKRVPALVFQVSDALVARFLSAFIDGDGSIVPQRNFIVLYSVSRPLLDDLALLLTRFSVFSRYHTTAPRLPGKKVLDIYARLHKEPVTHILHHLVIMGKDVATLKRVLILKEEAKKRKLAQLRTINKQRKTKFLKKYYPFEEWGDIILDYVKKIEMVESPTPSYCLEVEWEKKEERNILWGEQIINTRCDGDEAGLMLLMDALLNFSRQFLPTTRGSNMDSPLVLTANLNPAEVDDQVHGMDVAWNYPLELYHAAEEMKKPWEVRSGPEKKKVEQLADRLGTPGQYEGLGFTHLVHNFNKGVQCSAYKTLPSMEEKLIGQMEIARKVRAVDMDDVAKLVIQKHFLKDIKGNLRKFSMQQFRCVKCNEKYRRPPLSGGCLHCDGRLLFTITEGSVIKYLGPSLLLAEKYDFSPYLKQVLQILKSNVDGVFGKEKEKQVGLAGFV